VLDRLDCVLLLTLCGVQVPYNPNSIVNQMPVKFNNEPKHAARFCAPRNVSQVKIGGKNDYERRFVTSNSVYYVEHKGLPIGFNNQGITSERTKWQHWKQQL